MKYGQGDKLVNKSRNEKLGIKEYSRDGLGREPN